MSIWFNKRWQKWQAEKVIKWKWYYIGQYETKEEAIDAYNKWLQKRRKPVKCPIRGLFGYKD